MKGLLATLLISTTLALSSCNYDPRLDDQSTQKPPVPAEQQNYCLRGNELIPCQEGQQ